MTSKITFFLVSFSLVLGFLVQPVLTLAATATSTNSSVSSLDSNFAQITNLITNDLPSTAEATLAANLVDPIAKQTIQEKKDQDITEVTSTKNDMLASYLLEKPLDHPIGTILYN